MHGLHPRHVGLRGAGALLASVALSGVLAASVGAQSAAPSGDMKLVFWNNGPDVEKGWQSVAAGFNTKYPDVTVKLVPVAGTNWGEYLAGTATLLAGGEKPDLMWVATEGLQFLVKNGLVSPLDDLMLRDQAELADYLSDTAAPLVDGFKVDGKQYMLPYSWNDMVIYYNTDRFTEAGLEPPAADWTRADFVAAAKKLTVDADGDGTPEKYGFAFGNDGLFVSAMPWIYANGGSLVSGDFCSPTADSPEVIEALQFLHDLIYVDKVTPAPVAGADLFGAFQNGTAAMMGAGRWPMQTFTKAGFDHLNIQTWPSNKIQQTEFGVDGFPIFKDGANPDAAWAFLKYMTTKEVQDQLLGSAELPNTNIPARRSTADALKGMAPANSGAFYGAVDNGGKSVPGPARFNEFESTFLRYAGLVYANEMTPADAMAAAQAELSTIVTCS